MNDKDFETLAAVIYNTVQTRIAADTQKVIPFALASQTVQAAYIQAAHDAAMFVGNCILRSRTEEAPQ